MTTVVVALPRQTRRARRMARARRAALLRLLPVVALGLSGLLAWVVFVAQAPAPALGVIVALTLAGVILVKPVTGVYVTLLGVLTIEQYSFNPDFHPLTASVPLYHYVFGASVQITPLDLLLGLTVLGTAIEALRRPKPAVRAARRPTGLGIGLVALLLALVYADLHGAAAQACQGYSPVGGTTGCDYRFKITIYELRAFIYLAVAALLSVRLLDSAQRLRIVLRLFTIGIALKACQALYRQFLGMTHGFTEDQMRAVTAHEDALFFAIGIVMIIVALAYRARGGLERQFLAVAPLLLAAFLIANRRAAYVGLALSLPVLVAILPAEPRRRLVRVLAPMVVLFAVYVPAFWNKGGTQGRPAHAVKALFNPTGTDAASNLYRTWEKFDLLTTLKPVILLGQGLGRPYQQPIPLPLLNSQYQPYIAHQELLWFWVATGAVGVVALFLCFGGMFLTSSSALRVAATPTLAMVSAMAVAAIILQLVAADVDLQLTFFRNMTLVGLLVGAAASVDRLSRPQRVGGTT